MRVVSTACRLALIAAAGIGAATLASTDAHAAATNGAKAANAQETLDAGLWREIQQIRAIDNHTHADPADADRITAWDSGAPLGRPRYPDVAPLRSDNPEWRLAWRALYGYPYRDIEAGHVRALLETKRAKARERGESWPVGVLDAAGVQVALVNAAQLGAGQRNDRFRWVPYADPLLWPFAGDASPLRFAGGAISNERLREEAGLGSLPPTLDAYVEQLVQPTLARWKDSGAVAVKFLSAYARSLAFEPVERPLAAALYSKAAGGQALTAAERKTLEDFLFCGIAASAGARGLVVHVHTGNGDGPYFDNGRANPSLLEPALGSEPLRGTNFVLLHGGWPFTSVAQAMLDKPNTYADFSAQTFYLSTRALAVVLRDWLEWHPEKVLFGSDAYSDAASPLTDYEEKQWLMTYKARRALAIALTGMMRDEGISRARGVELARMVLHDNAARLYGIQ